MTADPGAAADAVDGAEPGAGGGLGTRAVRGAAVTVGGQLGRAVLQFGGLIVLARLLTPRDYGLLASVTAIVGVGEVLRDFGLSMAAVQARSITRGQRSNLFWLNVVVAVALAAVVVLAAPVIASFYGDDRLVVVTQALSLTLVLNGLAAQFRADLTRQLRFLGIAVIDIVALLLSIGVAIGLALAGAGVGALVAQQLTLTGATLLGVAVCARWLPSLPRRGESIRPFLAFGWNVMGTNLLGYASRNVDSIVIGRQFGAAPLGAYNRAFQVLLLPLNQINAPLTRVALPVLSRLQDDSKRFMDFVLRGQTVLVTLVIALFATAAAVAEPLFRVVLGPAWVDSAVYFQILAIGGIFQTAGYVANWIFLATGRTGAGLRFALVARPIVIAGILLGAFGGVVGVAIGYSAGLAVVWPLEVWWVRRSTSLPTERLLGNGARPMLTFGSAGVLGWFLVQHVVGDAPAGIRLLVGVVAVAVVALAWALVWRAFRADLREVARSVGVLVGRRRRRAPGPTDVSLQN